MGRSSGRYNSNPNKRYALCDKCHFKFHIKDLKLVDEKYNRINGLLVCKRCYSPTNPQDTPITIREKLVTDLKKMRPRLPAQYEVNPNDNRVPGAPGQGWARPNPLGEGIDLYWEGPEDVGTSSIIGYQIWVSSPQDVVYSILVNNTNNPAGYFLDTITNFDSQASYVIAAYNSFGLGPYSIPFYWPYKQDNGVNQGSRYLIQSPENVYILTGNNQPIQIQL